MASGDLNEFKIQELVAGQAPIDVFGVGTDLATSADAPSLGVVYKLVELESGSSRRYTAKLSFDKQTLPGAKQIFRYADHDKQGRSTECPSCPPGAPETKALLRPVMINGKLIQALPTAAEARAYAEECLAQLPAACLGLFTTREPYRVELTTELECLADKIKAGTPA
jgi:nicotinate phosphoribosyltransferase